MFSRQSGVQYAAFPGGWLFPGQVSATGTASILEGLAFVRLRVLSLFTVERTVSIRSH